MLLQFYLSIVVVFHGFILLVLLALFFLFCYFMQLFLSLYTVSSINTNAISVLFLFYDKQLEFSVSS